MCFVYLYKMHKPDLKRIWQHPLAKIGLVLVGLLFVAYMALFIYLQTQKHTILQKTIKALSNSLHTPVQVKDIDIAIFRNFPLISVQLKELELNDSLKAEHQQPLFHARRAFITMNPYALLLGKTNISRLQLQDGGLFFFTDSLGRSNNYVFQKKQPSEQRSSTFPLRKLVLERFSFGSINKDRQKDFRIYFHKLEAAFKDVGDSISIQLKHRLTVQSLAFNPDKASYAKDKEFITRSSKLSFVKKHKAINLFSSPWQINGDPFTIAAHFVLSGEPLFELQLHSPSIHYPTITDLVTPSIARALKKVALGGRISCNARIAGPLNYGEPHINIHWMTSPGALNTPVVNFDSASFRGYFNNQQDPLQERSDPNSIIVLTGFTGKFAGMPLRADSVVLTNLTTPRLRVRFLSDFQLSDLNRELASSLLAFEKGSGKLDLSFNGPVDHMDSSNTKIFGSLRFNEGSLRFAPLNISLTECKANISFNQANINITEIACLTTYQQPLVITGEAKNVIAAFNNHSPNKMMLDLRMKSPFINIDGISALMHRQPGATQKKKTFFSSAVKLDDLLQRGKVNVLMETDKLQHGRMEATGVKVFAILQEKLWTLNKLEMQHAGGSVSATGNLMEKGNGRFLLMTKAKVQNINARKLFYAFNDFGQTGIQHQHIDGKLSFHADLQIPVKPNGAFEPGGASGTVDFQFRDGRLQEYKALDKLKTFAFKNRNFDDVRFAELKDKLTIGNGVVGINRMYVESTVLTLFVSGKYDISGKDTDISLQLPLRNLAKRDSSYVLERSQTRGDGVSIFLRARSQKDGSISLRYDPLGRFRKKGSRK